MTFAIITNYWKSLSNSSPMRIGFRKTIRRLGVSRFFKSRIQFDFWFQGHVSIQFWVTDISFYIWADVGFGVCTWMHQIVINLRHTIPVKMLNYYFTLSVIQKGTLDKSSFCIMPPVFILPVSSYSCTLQLLLNAVINGFYHFIFFIVHRDHKKIPNPVFGTAFFVSLMIF